MKDYFSHDYNSRNDKKLVTAGMKFDLCTAIGAYWCIVEMLYEEGGYLLLSEYDRITYELRCSNELVTYLINDSELFKNDGEKFWSETAIERLKIRASKSQKARESIDKRWIKYKDTNVIPPKNERNTSKGKESKGKESNYKKYLLSEIIISDHPEINADYLEIAKAFQLLFKNNLIEAGASTKEIDKAKGTWVDDIRLLVEKDGYTSDDLRGVYKFLQKDAFWKQNILSTSKLREQFSKLKLKIKNGASRSSHKEGTTWDELASIVHKHFVDQG